MQQLAILFVFVVVSIVMISTTTMVFAQSAGNVTVAPGTKMANGTTMTTSKGIPIAVELNPSGSFAVSNLVFYGNGTDKAVHLKGLLKNILHETISGSTTIALTFRDKSTSTVLKPDIYTFIDKPLAPGATIPFDINTGYSPKNANQFPFIKALLTY